MRESMNFDVIIIGAGPAGLAASIRLMQLSKDKPLNVCVIEKAQSIGGHIVSGAVMDPSALNALLPDWQSLNPPTFTAATEDQFLLLTEKKAWRLPTPPQMKNEGNYLISLGQFCRWLSDQAEQLGVNVFPGFAATNVLYREDQVIGIATGDLGVDKHGQPKAQFQAGMDLFAKQIMVAEGCRGSIAQQLIKRYELTNGVDPQTYGLGIKEVWEVPDTHHRAGKVVHTIGWPLDNATYGGSFLYHFDKNLINVGFVVGLDYQNPYLNPYEEFQRFKMHPAIHPLLASGKRIAYGARTLIEGGLQSIPKLTFPGGVLIGDAAGFLDVPKIKGIHQAMQSGMIAAESIHTNLNTAECTAYTDNIQKSSVWKNLYHARNIRPGFTKGLWRGLLNAGIDTYLFRGRAPWTLHHQKADHESLLKAKNAQPIDYPPHDNQVSFDLSTSLFLANIHYDEDQPNHLKLQNPHVPIEVNLRLYAAPEQRYCPAGVYEIVQMNGKPALQMNYTNCIQCKACDIKDPTQNITWTPPEGGSGPNYGMM